MLEAHERFEFSASNRLFQVGVLGFLGIVRAQKDDAVRFGLCRMENDFFECVILEAGDAEVQARALERSVFDGIYADFAGFGVCLASSTVSTRTSQALASALVIVASA